MALRDSLTATAADANGLGSVIDITAAQGAMTILGPLAREVFARFTAIDLRPRVTPVHGWRPGSVARTGGAILCEAPDRYLMLFGASQTGLAFLLLTVGSRLIPATEAALISVLETPLAPVWVWAAFGEAPTAAAMVGGTIVLGAVVGHTAAETRPAPAPRDATGGDAAPRESPNW